MPAGYKRDAPESDAQSIFEIVRGSYLRRLNCFYHTNAFLAMLVAMREAPVLAPLQAAYR